jgi:hypothetical protein
MSRKKKAEAIEPVLESEEIEPEVAFSKITKSTLESKYIDLLKEHVETKYSYQVDRAHDDAKKALSLMMTFFDFFGIKLQGNKAAIDAHAVEILTRGNCYLSDGAIVMCVREIVALATKYGCAPKYSGSGGGNYEDGDDDEGIFR